MEPETKTEQVLKFDIIIKTAYMKRYEFTDLSGEIERITGRPLCPKAWITSSALVIYQGLDEITFYKYRIPTWDRERKVINASEAVKLLSNISASTAKPWGF